MPAKVSGAMVETVGDLIEAMDAEQKTSKAVAKAKPTPIARAAPADVKSDTANLMTAIITLGSNPNTNIDVIERMMQLYRETEAAVAKRAFIAAMADMQPNLPVINQRGRIIIREKGSGPNGPIIQDTAFAKYADIIRAIGPMMKDHGFAINFTPGLYEDGRVTCKAILSHRDGHEQEAMMILPHDSTGSKNAIQAIGSSTSYAKRMLTCALLNIVSEADDDDGATSEDDKLITDDQLTQLQAIADDRGADLIAFCKWAKVDSLRDIPAVDFDKAKWALESKKKKVSA